MKKKHGFTLLEILIVVAIIAIISTFLFPYVSNSLKDAKISKAKQDFSAIKDMVQSHYLSAPDIPGKYIAPIESESLILLDYFHDNGDFENKTTQERFHAIHALDYLNEMKNISVPTDPWGRKYSILVRSDTLPDAIDIDFSDNIYHITKVFKLDREAVSDFYVGKKAYKYHLVQPVPNTGSMGTVSPPAPTEKEAISFEFLYRYYYTKTRVAPYPTLQNIVLHYNQAMSETTNEYTLTPSNLGSPDLSKRYAKWKKAYITMPNGTINNLQDYSTYLSISIPPALQGNPNETRLEITGLVMRARVPYTVQTLTGFFGTTPVWGMTIGYTGWMEFYHSPFNGKIELTVISAGPDAEFNTYDDLTSDYSIKLNF